MRMVAHSHLTSNTLMEISDRLDQKLTDPAGIQNIIDFERF